MFVNQSEVIKHIENKFGNRLSYVSSPYQNINLPYFKDMDTGIDLFISQEENTTWGSRKKNIWRFRN